MMPLLVPAVYGSTIETCQWLTYVRSVTGSDKTGFDLLVDVGILEITPPLNESSNAIGTPSYVIQIMSSTLLT